MKLGILSCFLLAHLQPHQADKYHIRLANGKSVAATSKRRDNGPTGKLPEKRHGDYQDNEQKGKEDEACSPSSSSTLKDHGSIGFAIDTSYSMSVEGRSLVEKMISKLVESGTEIPGWVLTSFASNAKLRAKTSDPDRLKRNLKKLRYRYGGSPAEPAYAAILKTMHHMPKNGVVLMITDVGTEGLNLEESIIRESRKKNIKIYIAFVPNCRFKGLCKRSMPSYEKISGGRIYNLTKAADFDSEKFFNDVIFEVKRTCRGGGSREGWQPETGDAALLTGGSDIHRLGSARLSSTVLYPESCSVPSMDEARSFHVTFLTRDSPPRIATCGGAGTNGDPKDCLVLRDGQWRGGELDDLPEERFKLASARLEEGVFLLGSGGWSYSKSKSSVFLRANSRSWESGPGLPVSMREGPCAAPIGSHSFLIVHETDVYEFDTRVAGPTDDAGWRPKEKWPQLQVYRYSQPGCGVIKNMFVVAGGEACPGCLNDLKSTEIIDLVTKKISFGGEMEKKRAWFHLLSIDGNLFAFGGINYGGDLADVEEFVEETGTWKPAKSLDGKRYRYGGVAVTKDLVCG